MCSDVQAQVIASKSGSQLFQSKQQLIKYLIFQVPPELDEVEIRTKLGLNKLKGNSFIV